MQWSMKKRKCSTDKPAIQKPAQTRSHASCAHAARICCIFARCSRVLAPIYLRNLYHVLQIKSITVPRALSASRACCIMLIAFVVHGGRSCEREEADFLSLKDPPSFACPRPPSQRLSATLFVAGEAVCERKEADFLSLKDPPSLRARLSATLFVSRRHHQCNFRRRK